MAAADMFARGKRQVDVVDALGVSAQTASRWHRIFLAEGKSGLAGAGRAGRLPKLSDEQLAQVEQALLKGPRANGFSTEMWTLARVADVIETVTGVRYGQTQTWTVLRERLGWSRQRPARRAVERDDEAIATWVKQDWPRIKSARRRGAWIVFQDESGFSLLPPVRGTWAPKGRTPVLRHRFSWTRLSMSGALAYRPDASEAALMFQIKEGSYNTDSLIEFLTDLHAHFGGDKITVIWDNLPSHKSKAMTAWIAGQRKWLTVERLPGYAHDLNPIEMVWGNVKTVELANLCPDTIDEAHAAAESGLNRVGSSYDLCFAFLAHTGLSL